MSDKIISVQERINIKDIKGNILYSRDGYLFSYLKVQPISTALMSRDEKARIAKRITEEISPFNVPFKLIFLSRPTDVKKIIEYYDGIKQQTADSNKRESINQTMRFLSESSLQGGVLERQTFLVVYLQADKNQPKDVLYLVNQLQQALLNAGIKSSILAEREIVQLCSLYLSPNYSNTVTDINPNYTMLGGEE